MFPTVFNSERNSTFHVLVNIHVLRYSSQQQPTVCLPCVSCRGTALGSRRPGTDRRSHSNVEVLLRSLQLPATALCTCTCTTSPANFGEQIRNLCGRILQVNYL